MAAANRGSWLIALTFAVALFLTVLPLPEQVLPWRPDWLILTTLYWCLALPGRIGLLPAWICGLFIDASQGATLGMNALALSTLAACVISARKRLRIAPLIQQALAVFAYLLCYQACIWLMCRLFSLPVTGWSHWFSCVTSAILWPWLFVILRDLRRRHVR